MIGLYIGLGVVVGIPMMMLIVGLFLPERFEARVAVTLDRGAQDVWAALMDYQANPVSGKMRKKSEPLPDVNGLSAWKEDIGSSQITVTTEDATPATRLRRTLRDSVVPMTAETEITLESTPAGCRATATSVIIIRAGTWHVPFFRVMVGLFGGAKMGLKDFWKRLAANLQAAARFE